MATITAFDAKTRFGELLDRVATGEEIVITRHDKPVARIVPENRNNLADIQDAVNGLRELRQQISSRKKGGRKLTDKDVRSALEEGRR
jgi:prevent-host-death family protein